MGGADSDLADNKMSNYQLKQVLEDMSSNKVKTDMSSKQLLGL